MIYKYSGFTLIELIIVIVLLGILAATALPRFVDFTDDTRDAVMSQYAGAFRQAVTHRTLLWHSKGKPSTINTINGSNPDLHFNADGVIDGASNGASTASAGWSHASCKALYANLLDIDPSDIVTPDDPTVTTCHASYTDKVTTWCVNRWTGNPSCMLYNHDFADQLLDEYALIYCTADGTVPTVGISCDNGDVRTYREVSGVATPNPW